MLEIIKYEYIIYVRKDYTNKKVKIMCILQVFTIFVYDYVLAAIWGLDVNTTQF